MSRPERVLIAPWGNPFFWWEANYKVDCEKLGIKDCKRTTVTVTSKSTLPAMIEAINPDRVIVVVLDTLVNARKDEKYPPIGDAKPSTYLEVVEDVKRRVQWFMDEIGIDNAEILVAPGVGEFKNATVLGDILDFYAFVLYELSKRLPRTNSEVFLDLTHGINFMPVIMYRAVNHLLGLSAYVNDVTLTVVNSEPALDEKGVMSMEVIERELFRPRPMYSLLTGGEREELWSAFISSMANGFPLAFATFYPDKEEVVKTLDNTFREWMTKGIDVTSNGKVEIRRKKKLGHNFRTLSKLMFLLEVLEERGWSRYKKKVLTFGELREIAGLFRRMPTIGPVVERQVNELERAIEGANIKEPKPLREFLGKAWSRKVKVGNFIAHAGFEGNIVYVNYSRAKRDYVFYYGDEETARRLCVEALKYRG